MRVFLIKKGVFQASNEITESQLDLIIERFYTGEPLQNAIQSEDEIIEQNVLSIPVLRSMFTDDKLDNLQKLVEGKQTLMKHAFRCFLLRLGFIGDDSKAARRILLKKLSGNTAFRKA